MRRRLLGFIPLLGLFCATGLCAYGLTRPNALNLILAALVTGLEVAPTACGPDSQPAVGTFHAYGTHSLADGFIIFFAVDCIVPGQSTRTFTGSRRYVMQGFSWKVSASDFSWQAPPTGQPPVDYDLHMSLSQGPPYTAVSGQVLTDTVSTVIVTFANGDVQRETPNHGYFAALTPQGVMACRLDLLDAHGQLVQTYDLSIPPPVPAEFGACPP